MDDNPKSRGKSKIILIIAGTAAGVAVLAAGIFAIVKFTFLDNLIGKDGAEEIALQDAGIDRSDAAALRTGLEKDDGVWQYEVDFHNGGIKYEYRIEAESGYILTRDREGSGSGGAAGSDRQENTGDTGNTGSGSGNGASNGTGDNSNGSGQTGNEAYIGLDRAKQIALDHAKLAESQVRFGKTQLENDDGRMEYEIEFYEGTTEYDYQIDAVTGDIIGFDKDRY